METLCLAELLAGLSLVADVGMRLEPGEAARAALVAVELAIEVGAPDATPGAQGVHELAQLGALPQLSEASV